MRMELESQIKGNTNTNYGFSVFNTYNRKRKMKMKRGSTQNNKGKLICTSYLKGIGPLLPQISLECPPYALVLNPNHL